MAALLSLMICVGESNLDPGPKIGNNCRLTCSVSNDPATLGHPKGLPGEWTRRLYNSPKTLSMTFSCSGHFHVLTTVPTSKRCRSRSPCQAGEDEKPIMD